MNQKRIDELMKQLQALKDEEPTEGPTEEPTEGPTEEPTEEPTEGESVLSLLDDMMTSYKKLQSEFNDLKKTYKEKFKPPVGKKEDLNDLISAAVKKIKGD